MNQTKRHSLLESLTNVGIGFAVTLLFSPAIYALCGVEMGFGKMGSVTACFTVLSVARGYVVRQWFNGKRD